MPFEEPIPEEPDFTPMHFDPPAPEEPAVATVPCRFCGEQIRVGSAFCKNCGKSTSEPEVPPVEEPIPEEPSIPEVPDFAPVHFDPPAPEEPTVDTVPCRFCGEQIRVGSAFCKNCGKSTSEPEVPPVEEPIPEEPAAEPAIPEESDFTPMHFDPPASEEPTVATVPCRFCGEQIRVGSAFCKHCGKSTSEPEVLPVEESDFEEPTVEPSIPEEPDFAPVHFDPPAPEEPPVATVPCRFCGEQIRVGSAFCKNCGKSTSEPEVPPVEEPTIEEPAAEPAIPEEPVFAPMHFDPPAPEEPATVPCRFCGEQIRVGSAFCKNCGKSTSEPEVPPVEEPIPEEPSIPEVPDFAPVHFDPPAPEEPTVATLPCRFCGEQIRVGSAFCKNCGKSTSEPEVPPVEEPAIEEPTPAEPEVSPVEEPIPEEPEIEEPTVGPSIPEEPIPEIPEFEEPIPEEPEIEEPTVEPSIPEEPIPEEPEFEEPTPEEPIPEEPNFEEPAVEPSNPEEPDFSSEPAQDEPSFSAPSDPTVRVTPPSFETPSEEPPVKGKKSPKPPKAPKPPKQRKKRKVKWILISILLLLLAAAAVFAVLNLDTIRGWFSRSDGEASSEPESNGSTPGADGPDLPLPEDLQLSDFASKTFDVYLGEEKDVLFTVKVSASEPLPPESLALYDENGELLGYMNDDGINGDEYANDSVYSAQIRVSSQEMRLANYYASAGEAKSEPFELCFYRDLTEAEFNSFSKLLDTVSALSFEAASDYVQNSSEIQTYNIDTDGRIISYQSVYGFYGVWQDFSGNTKGNGEFAVSTTLGVNYNAVGERIPSLTFTPATAKHDVVVLRPYRGTEFPYDDFKNVGSILADALGGRLEVIDDEAVTLEVLKALSFYGTVLIDSHGTLIGSDPYMLIGEELDEETLRQDPNHLEKFSADYYSGRIYCVGGQGRLAVGSKFFDKYYSAGDLVDSCWFLGACYSLCNDTLADVLTAKGAGAVIGFSDPVSVDYCNQVLFESVLNSMLLSADTAGNAVQCAKTVYGALDPHNADCEARMRGRDEFRLVSAVTQTPGTLSGKVCKASDRITPIPEALINIYRGDTLITILQADRNGNYSVDLPEGQYLVTVSDTRSISLNAYAAVTGGEITYMETFLMVEGSEQEIGTAGGTVINTLTGVGVEGVTLTFVRDWNNTDGSAEVLASVITGADGAYTVDLPLGNYTVIAAKEDHLPSSFNIVVQSGVTENQNGTITPIISGDSYLITLTWGKYPEDLDSHMEGTLLNGNHFHVYFQAPFQYDGEVKMCELDFDDGESYGPEHITLNATTNAPYYYYVRHYAGSGSLSESGAKVTVHHGNALIAEFNIPPNLGNDDCWNVFAIKDGKLIVSNTITHLPDLTYAD